VCRRITWPRFRAQALTVEVIVKEADSLRTASAQDI
jgi:hypothetical protein